MADFDDTFTRNEGNHASHSRTLPWQGRSKAGLLFHEQVVLTKWVPR